MPVRARGGKMGRSSFERRKRPVGKIRWNSSSCADAGAEAGALPLRSTAGNQRLPESKRSACSIIGSFLRPARVSASFSETPSRTASRMSAFDT